jgi:hypothetical protein
MPQAAAVKDTEALTDLDRLDPVLLTVTLLSGVVYSVLRIKTRQFFRLMRILTHGAGERVLRGALKFEGSSEEFSSSLMQVLLLSIPDAEEETIYFIQSMLRPLGLAIDREDGTKVTKDDDAADKVKWAQLSKDTYNPELEDLVTIFAAIVRQEASEIQALGKRLGDLLQAQFPSLRPSEKTKTTDSSEATPELSTPSAGTTDGPTT